MTKYERVFLDDVRILFKVGGMIIRVNYSRLSLRWLFWDFV